jgi:hypothetical protein
VLDARDLERLRRLTPAERLRLGLDLTDLAWRFLMRLPPEEAQRRLDLGRERWNPPPARPARSS